MRDPVAEILRFNRRFRGRYPHLLRRKVDLMCGSPFVFFRGTFHLFARDWVDHRFDAWPESSPLQKPEVRLCADLHGENFGTYGGEHHTALYGINDFDESTSGRLDFDACRAATSLLLAGSTRGLLLRSAAAGAHAFVEMYMDAIDGSPKPFRSPLIRQLIRTAERAKRSEFIGKRTELRGGRRRFAGEKFFRLTDAHEKQARRLHEDYRSRTKIRKECGPDFFEVEDVSGRIAGCGSLGRLRYVVLVRGEDPKEAREVILEYKEALPSALDEALGRGIDLKARRNRAQAVVEATRCFQVQSDPFLGHAIDGDQSFQVRQVGPREFRLDGAALTGGRQFRETASSYGAYLAAAHRRANGNQALRVLRDAVGKRREAFVRRTMSFAMAYAEQVDEDWRALLKAREQVTRKLSE
ncbi:MAG TPA: DUF2252 family protein [Planctomycetota bacterium]|nr:DUF2252 family protein [Planctomycetota bacterium]